MAAKKNLKRSLEDELKKMLDATGEPSEGRMKLIALGIKMCALNAKLEENDFGEFFRDDESGSTSSVPKGEKPAARSRANGGADA
jgi:hypothetical protein